MVLERSLSILELLRRRSSFWKMVRGTGREQERTGQGEGKLSWRDET